MNKTLATLFPHLPTLSNLGNHPYLRAPLFENPTPKAKTLLQHSQTTQNFKFLSTQVELHKKQNSSKKTKLLAATITLLNNPINSISLKDLTSLCTLTTEFFKDSHTSDDTRFLMLTQSHAINSPHLRAYLGYPTPNSTELFLDEAIRLHDKQHDIEIAQAINMTLSHFKKENVALAKLALATLNYVKTIVPPTSYQLASDFAKNYHSDQQIKKKLKPTFPKSQHQPHQPSTLHHTLTNRNPQTHQPRGQNHD